MFYYRGFLTVLFILALTVISCKSSPKTKVQTENPKGQTDVPVSDTVTSRPREFNNAHHDFYDSLQTKVILKALKSGSQGETITETFKEPRIDGFLHVKYTASYYGTIENRKAGLLKFAIFTISMGMDGKYTSETNFIEVANERNELLGDYMIDSASSLPTAIEGTSIVFDLRGNSKGCTKKTLLDFKDSIPTEVFLWCKNSGQYLKFSKRERN